MKKAGFISVFLLFLFVLFIGLWNYIKVDLSEMDYNDIEEVQESFMDILEYEGLNDEQKGNFLRILPDLNWDALSEINGVDFQANLLSWIYNVQIDTKEEISPLIGIMSKFSGEYQNEFNSFMGSIYKQNKIEFIKALNNHKGYVNVLALLFYEIEVYDRVEHNISNDFKMYFETSELSNEEKEVAYKLIQVISSCET